MPFRRSLAAGRWPLAAGHNSECCALNYYLTETSNKAYRAAWGEYRKAIAAGRDEPLSKFIKDMDAFEKDWVRFVTGL